MYFTVFKFTQLGFNPMTNCVRVQHATTELTGIGVYCCEITLIKDNSKSTWFVKLEIKVK
jgi:hypothetical protein